MPAPIPCLRRQLFRLTTPIFVEILLVMLREAMGVIMLNPYGDNAVTAVGVDGQILNMVFLIFGAFTAGAMVLCVRYRGACQQQNRVRVIGLSLLFNSLAGLAVRLLPGLRRRSRRRTLTFRSVAA